eukprot:scaffold68395_cov53-Cyclotella_meneghiniana.AAC.1
MSRQPPQAARLPTASVLSSAASVTVAAAGAVRSGARSVAQFAGTKLSFVSPPTTTSNAKAPTWTKRSCICSRQTECRGIMREWEKLGDEYACMLDYVFIPPISTKTNDIGKHKNGYRKMCFLHLFGRGTNAKELQDKLDENKYRLPVAVHHFKPCVREAIGRSKVEKKEVETFRCSKEEGIQAGLTDIDL